jgi:hypothetical protein
VQLLVDPCEQGDRGVGLGITDRLWPRALDCTIAASISVKGGSLCNALASFSEICYEANYDLKGSDGVVEGIS